MQTASKHSLSPAPLALASEAEMPRFGISAASALAFKLPPELEAGEPPEARGLARDAVRLMVSYKKGNRVVHTRFSQLPDYLAEGDLLVINTSGTLNAALPATRASGSALELHLSTRLPGDAMQAAGSVGLWSVELRLPGPDGTKPFFDGRAGETLTLPGGGEVTLLAPYMRDVATANFLPSRLWLASLRLPEELHDYLARNGFPIRYGYVKQAWPAAYYPHLATVQWLIDAIFVRC